jgi:hypothetical protein
VDTNRVNAGKEEAESIVTGKDSTMGEGNMWMKAQLKVKRNGTEYSASCRHPSL